MFLTLRRCGSPFYFSIWFIREDSSGEGRQFPQSERIQKGEEGKERKKASRAREQTV
jgi:hypothetical protein